MLIAASIYASEGSRGRETAFFKYQLLYHDVDSFAKVAQRSGHSNRKNRGI